MSSNIRGPIEVPRNYFDIQKALLKVVGIDLDADATSPFYLLLVLALIMSYLCVELLELVECLDDFDVVTNITLHLIGFCVGILKALVLFYNRRKLKRILKLIESNCKVSKLAGGDLEMHMIKDCITQSNKQTTYCLVPLNLVFLGTASATLLRGLLFHTWRLPFAQLTIIDVSNSLYYAIMWLHQMTAFILASAAYFTAEVLITAVSAHLCVQCRIVQNFIRHVRERKCTNWKKHDSLKKIVIRHSYVYHLAEEVQGAFNVALLIMLASDVLIICFSAFHASLYPLNDIQCLRDIGIALSIIMKDLVVCYWGNEVSLVSQTTADACYDAAHIVEEDVSFQKGLLLVMIRSQRPIIITAGKFAPLSLETFIWIVKTAYSYFAVLRSHSVE